MRDLVLVAVLFAMNSSAGQLVFHPYDEQYSEEKPKSFAIEAVEIRAFVDKHSGEASKGFKFQYTDEEGKKATFRVGIDALNLSLEDTLLLRQMTLDPDIDIKWGLQQDRRRKMSDEWDYYYRFSYVKGFTLSD